MTDNILLGYNYDSHRLLIAAISNIKDNSKCKSDQTELIT